MGTAPDRKLRHLEISSSVAQPLQGLKEIREKGSKRRASLFLRNTAANTRFNPLGLICRFANFSYFYVGFSG